MIASNGTKRRLLCSLMTARIIKAISDSPTTDWVYKANKSTLRAVSSSAEKLWS